MYNQVMYNQENDFLIWADNVYYIESIEEYAKRQKDAGCEWIADASDECIAESYWDENRQWLDDEIANIDCGATKCRGSIIMIASLGLWNGRASAHRLVGSKNIADCLKSGYLRSDSSSVIYVTGNGELCHDESHHDGTNHYYFREVVGGDAALERLETKLCDGTATQEYIDKVTRPLGKKIAKLYGWTLHQPTTKVG